MTTSFAAGFVSASAVTPLMAIMSAIAEVFLSKDIRVSPGVLFCPLFRTTIPVCGRSLVGDG
jgi:hypothetical protein